MRKNSIAWRFFDRVEDNKGHCSMVVCKLCEAEYKFFGNTTNLRVHLSRKHPIQWELAHNNNEETGLEETESGSSIAARKKYITIEGECLETDNELTQIDEGGTNVSIANESHKPDSDEEWLEDPFHSIEVYKRKKKRTKMVKRIKQEYDESTPNRLANLYLQSPLKYDNQQPERTIVLEDPQHKDEYSTFGDYIANKLRKLNSPRTRGNIQQIITTVLWQAEYGTYDSADSVKIFFSKQNPPCYIGEKNNEAETAKPNEDDPIA